MTQQLGAPAPTVSQQLATLAADVAAYELVFAGAGGRPVEFDEALAAVTHGRNAVASFAEFNDADVTEQHYVDMVRLYRAVKSFCDELIKLDDVDKATTDRSNDLAARCKALAQLLLNAIAVPRVPQRGVPSVGFEYEVVGITVVTPNIPDKAVLQRWEPGPDQPGVRLEVDSGHVEFVTEPAGTLDQVRAQIAIIQQQIQAMEAAPNRRTTFNVPQPLRSAVDGSQVFPANYQVKVEFLTGGDRGKVQATAACSLDDLPELIVMHADGAGYDGFTDDPNHPQAVALARLVNYHVTVLDSKEAKREKQGPKVLLPVMFRTGLRALYRTLSQADQNKFKQLVGYQGTGDIHSRSLITGGYLGPAGYPYEGVKVGEWVNSIVDGDKSGLSKEPLDRDVNGDGPRGGRFDLLSPPEGYPAHRRGRHFTYAMGIYGVATDNSALVELREIWPQGGDFNLQQLEAQALEFAGQRFETRAQRKQRLMNRIQQALNTVTGGRRRPRQGDAASVANLIMDLPASDQKLCDVWYIEEAIANAQPPQPVVEQTNKRKAPPGTNPDQVKKGKK